MSTKPSPQHLSLLRVPTDVRLSPDGTQVCFVVKSNAPDRSGYRALLGLAPADGSEEPRQLTLGANRDVAPRWSPDMASRPYGSGSRWRPRASASMPPTRAARPAR